MLRALCVTILFLLSLPAALCQYADVSTAGGPVAIASPWRFHTGDDPAWAAPNFDDSHWSLLRLDKSWPAQGYKDYSGFAWYRIKLKLPATGSSLALGLYEIGNADEVYADGRLVGTIGKMRPVPVWLGYSPLVFPVALPRALNGKTFLLAIRVWQPQEPSGGFFTGLSSNPSVGTARAIASLRDLETLRYAIGQLPIWLVGAVSGCVGMFSLGLFLLRRRADEYAWAALFLLLNACYSFGYWFYRTCPLPAYGWVFAEACFEAAILIFWLLFIWRFLRIPVDNLLRVSIILLLLAPIPVGLPRYGSISITEANLPWVFISLALAILVFARLVRLAWRGSRYAQFLLVPFVLSALMTAISGAYTSLYYMSIIKSAPVLWLYRGPEFAINWNQVFMLLAELAVAAILLLRFAESAERDERLSAEMEAAHSVQAQLVPAQLPRTQHFQFEAAYLAASEVGGDFYQVFPEPDGSVLLAIGDVSGKGLKAAMLGTLVVGALRTLAAESLRPAEILARLNGQLVATTDGGFVTCSVAHLSDGGQLTFANAGHLAPYRNGIECKSGSGLPLGVVPGTSYTEFTLSLDPGDRLTFLSDGVVEARNKAGELFGFERAADISAQPAETIAAAAQAHGQEDDITVLTVIRAEADGQRRALELAMPDQVQA